MGCYVWLSFCTHKDCNPSLLHPCCNPTHRNVGLGHHSYTTAFPGHSTVSPQHSTMSPRFLHLLPPLLLLFGAGQQCVAARPLLVFLIDGFRYDYMDDLHALPGFSELVSNGVKVDYMTPDFPSLSYPNYYSLMTGNPANLSIHLTQFWSGCRTALSIKQEIQLHYKVLGVLGQRGGCRLQLTLLHCSTGESRYYNIDDNGDI